MLGPDRLEVLVQAAVGGVVRDDVQRFAVAQHGRPDQVHAPDVHGADQHPGPVRARLVEALDVVDGDQLVGIVTISDMLGLLNQLLADGESASGATP